MIVITVINNDGQVLDNKPATNDSVALLFSKEAADAILLHFDSIRGRCNRCGLIVRSTELAGGMCNNVGCHIDTDVNAVLRMTEPMRTLHITSKVDAALDKMLELHAKKAPTKAPEPKPEPKLDGNILDKESW